MTKEFATFRFAPARGLTEALALVLAVFFALAACSPSGSEPGPNPAPAQNEAGAQPDPGAAEPRPGPQAAPDAWPSSRADNLNTGRSGSPDVRAGKVAWSWQAETQITQTPVAADGVVYVGDWSPAFHAVSLATGELIWRAKPHLVKNDNRKLPAEGESLIDQAVANDFDDRYEFSAPVLFEDLVISCTRYGVLSAFRRSDGEVVWERDVDAEVYSSLRLARGKVLFGDSKGRFRGFDARSGEQLFSYQTADMLGSTCAVLSDGVAIFPGHDRRLHMVNIETGLATRVIDMTFRSTSTPLIAFGCIYLLHSGRHLVAYDLVDGRERWIQPATETTSNGLARAGDLVIAHIANQLRAYDGVTGLPAWRVELDGAGAIAPAVGPELVYIVDDGGWAHAIDPRQGVEVWKDRFAESAAAAPILVGARLICADQKGRLVAYE